MVFRGSLGTGGTITSLPADGSAAVGDTYKVITAGTYDGKAAKVGDTFICLTKTSSANTWELIPSGDETDTWRSISVDGVEKLGNSISSGGVNFVGGNNVTLTYASNNITVSATNTATATGTETFVKGDATFEWDAGSAATLGTAIPADDITSWSAGTLPTVSYSDGVLYFNEGSLPSLQYTAKSIPNVTSAGTVPSLSWSTASAVTGVST